VRGFEANGNSEGHPVWGNTGGTLPTQVSWLCPLVRVIA
jgi:hypothetical protein